jgi:hypothetical protein
VIPAIISILGAFFSAAGKLFDWLNSQRLVDLGKTSQQLENLKAQVDAANRSVKVRLAVERAFIDKPDSVPDDDGFKRPDGE